MLCASQAACKPVARFQARVNVLESSGRLHTAGYASMMHMHSLSVLASWDQVRRTALSSPVPVVVVGPTSWPPPGRFAAASSTRIDTASAGRTCSVSGNSPACLNCSCALCNLQVLGVLDKRTGKARKMPFVRAGQTCDVIIELPEPACVETYKNFPQLGRFVLREDGATVGIGVVTSVDAPPAVGGE